MKKNIISFLIIFFLYLPISAFSWKCVISSYFDWFLAPVFKNMPQPELVYKNALVGIGLFILLIVNINISFLLKKEIEDVDVKDNQKITDNIKNNLEQLFLILCVPWILMFIGYLVFKYLI
ncbi:MAG: hypothetical protein U0469_00970 [Candidatus Paceibacterota bacterium]|jgi:hypothetical protein